MNRVKEAGTLVLFIYVAAVIVQLQWNPFKWDAVIQKMSLFYFAFGLLWREVKVWVFDKSSKTKHDR